MTKHTITIDKDGRVITSDRVGTGANAFFDEHVIGTIGVDVEIVDERVKPTYYMIDEATNIDENMFEVGKILPLKEFPDPVQQERERILSEVEKLRITDQDIKDHPLNELRNDELDDIINIIKDNK